MRLKYVFLPLAALLILLPYRVPAYIVSLTLLIFMYIILAESWNIISGYTGYVSFGHVAFFGLGAYAAAILITKAAIPWYFASIIGGAVAVVLSLVIGFPCLRLKGPYFAIALLGLNEAVRLGVSSWESLTGGGYGLHLPPEFNLIPIYYAMGGTALIVVFLTYRLAISKFGLSLIAIREDEVAAEAMGINTTKYKLMAFALSAFFPGVAGGIYAWYISYIDPDTVFAVLITVQMIIMTMFGGAGTVLGPVIGAASLTLISEMFWIRFPFLHQALFGVLIVGVVILMPGGVMAMLKHSGIVPDKRGY